jgi:rod shape-determining protein MreD
MTTRGSFLIIPLTLIVALTLVLLPLPNWGKVYRPDWVTLVAIYWSLAAPTRFSIGQGWLWGLVLDVSQGTLLGQHALGIALVTYIVVRLHQRIRVQPLGQQALVILLLLLLKQSIMLWINGILGYAPDNLLVYFAPSVIGLLLWPWLFVILRDLRRRNSLV